VSDGDDQQVALGADVGLLGWNFRRCLGCPDVGSWAGIRDGVIATVMLANWWRWLVMRVTCLREGGGSRRICEAMAARCGSQKLTAWGRLTSLGSF